jgi:beta-D-galactosyl-(1->4)-L-rhamnose phosphorylase
MFWRLYNFHPITGNITTMDNESLMTGGFTLPGESGYEALTLRLAKKWGADVIRDSDGTQLSDDIIHSPYDIYSTVCLVRSHNAWARQHPRCLQQCCIMSKPILADGPSLTIDPLSGYFDQQFRINRDDDPKTWWQVFDRTTQKEIPTDQWNWDPNTGAVTIRDTIPWHRYTVNFFAYRIWEEISMYNHVTNNWGDREHEIPIDPIFPEAQTQILSYLDQWLESHPLTKVVRLTAMFYNFWWLWGDPKHQRFIVNDWGSYEFTVSPESIRQFEQRYGYRPCSEQFVNAGLYNNSYKAPSPFYLQWIDFINTFVTEFGKQCLDRIHAAGKKAFLFYNDHWIGVEPTGKRFSQMGFDGIIDGIFNGFEARKVAECPAVTTREIRMHPYLFPTGVNGAPSFLPGGNPTAECKSYWMDIRRALLRKPVDRIGFGGYLHLVENHPDFIDSIEHLAHEFRLLRNTVRAEEPWSSGIKVGLLTAWGHLRAWACRGHFNRGNPYNEVMESLSGMPVDTVFLSFEDILTQGIPSDIDVIINAGRAGDAWSGGHHWANPDIIVAISAFIAQGGAFLGIGEPSALEHHDQYFQLAHLLGVDRDRGLTEAFDRPTFDLDAHFLSEGITMEDRTVQAIDRLFLTSASARVVQSHQKSPQIVTHEVLQGRTAYFADFRFGAIDTRLLHRTLHWLTRKESQVDLLCPSNPKTDCAYFPDQQKLVVVNNTATTQHTTIQTETARVNLSLEPHGIVFHVLKEP